MTERFKSFNKGYRREPPEHNPAQFQRLGKRTMLAKEAGFRSVPEWELSLLLDAAGYQGWEYESVNLRYVQTRGYRPDFSLGTLMIEVKGWWPAADRQKYLHAVKQHPELQFLVLLQRPGGKINPRSTTTYAAWCDKQGLAWAPYPKTKRELIQCLENHSWPRTSPAPGATAATEPPNERTDPSTASSASSPAGPMASHPHPGTDP